MDAWEFLTVELKLPKEKLWITVYKDDKEAEDIWLNEMGADPDRFSRLGEKDNFWSMGDTGPCGPCSELFFDHGPDVAGGPPGSPEEDGDRYIEIWNLVFMQFNRAADGSMTPLPKPSVDTGMGLERIAAVMQGVHSNYEIDLFQALLAAAAKACATDDVKNNSLKVIADHIRSCAFLVLDGVVPSNEGRGYVLRRIIRRAVRHGNKLGAPATFFHTLVSALVDQMATAYPELAAQQSKIEEILLAEEQQFAKTLDQGMRILEQDLSELGVHGKNTISGETAFKLYDTYGFPVDLTADIARERGLSVDMPTFETCMEAQRTRARAAGQFGADYANSVALDGETTFTGYQLLTDKVGVLNLIVDGELKNHLRAPCEAIVVLESTPFYAESGGQVGDSGWLESAGVTFRVDHTVKLGKHHAHKGELLDGELRNGDELSAVVDSERRGATAVNHSATHLLHAALRNVLGEHVLQKGSLVDAERLRFDFAHNHAVTDQELQYIEDEVNAQVRANSAVNVEEMAIDAAMDRGAMALFGEKYGDEVRLLTMGGDYSVELCGGTHVNRTGDIGLLRIVSESGISSGVRRIEAVTGASAFNKMRQSELLLQQLAGVLKTNSAGIFDRVSQLSAEQKGLEKEVSQLKAKQASSAGSDLLASAVEVAGVKVIAAQLPGVDAKSLRVTLDQLKDKLGSGVVFLASEKNGKMSLISGVTKDLQARFSAGSLMREVAPIMGGKGGGRDDMAQGAGTDPTRAAEALEAVHAWVVSQAS